MRIATVRRQLNSASVKTSVGTIRSSLTLPDFKKGKAMLRMGSVARLCAISTLMFSLLSYADSGADIRAIDIAGISLGATFDVALDAAVGNFGVSKEDAIIHDRIHPWLDRSLAGFTVQNENSILTAQFIRGVPPTNETSDQTATYVEYRIHGDKELFEEFLKTSVEKYGRYSYSRDDSYTWCSGVNSSGDKVFCEKEAIFSLSMSTLTKPSKEVIKLTLMDYGPDEKLSKHEISLNNTSSTETVSANGSFVDKHDAFVGIYGTDWKEIFPFQWKYSRNSHKKFNVPHSVFRIVKDGDAFLFYYRLSEPDDFDVLVKTESGFTLGDIVFYLSENKNKLYAGGTDIVLNRITDDEWGDIEPHAIKKSCSQHKNYIGKQLGLTTYGQLNDFSEEYYRDYYSQICRDNDKFYTDDIDCDLAKSESKFTGKKIVIGCQ